MWSGYKNRFCLREIAMLINILVSLIASSHFALADGEYTKHESNLQQLTSQIATEEKKIRDAIEEKNQTTDKLKYHELIDEIKTTLKKRKDDIAHYNKEYHHIQYEHPEKLGQFEKKYKKFDEKSVKEFEDEINKLISSVQQNVKKKYNP
jgi:predicted  nucleic acid-binding Zn-ribbon protein